MTSTPWRRRLPWLALGIALLLGVAPARDQVALARGRPGGLACAEPCVLSLKALQRLSEPQLEQLYAQAEAAPLPVGFVRGQVLTLTGTPLPKVSARLFGLVWKGKVFDEDGGFVNQWLGFRAIHSCAAYGPSWYDGRPSLVLEYPEGTPLFANMRDEVRALGPCLYLSRLYDRCPRRFRGFVGMQLAPGHGRSSH